MTSHLKKGTITFVSFVLTSFMQEWRNWQTRRLQVPVVAISCGFKSHLLHLLFLAENFGFQLLFF